MVKKLILLPTVLLIIISMSACDNNSNESEESGSGDGFESVSGDLLMTELRHIATGCHYIKTTGTGSGITPMFIEKDGQTVPYCD